MSITEYSGNILLQSDTIEKIQKEADLLLANKDVAEAWRSSRHIKSELAKLDAVSVKPVLSVYRAITAKLKALALPLLDIDEISSLLQNNLEFIDSQAERYLISGIQAWLASQPEEDQKKLKQRILSVIPKNNPIKDVIARSAVPQSRTSDEAIPAKSAAVTKHGIAAVARRFGGLPPATTSGRRNDSLFDKEESSELEKHAKKAEEVGTTGLQVNNLGELAQKIFAISGTSEDKGIFLRRAESLLKSRLRDVRTRLDLQEYFSRAFAVGGLGLSGDRLSGALGIAENAYKEVHAHGVKALEPRAKEKIDKLISQDAPAEFDLASELSKKVPKPAKSPIQKFDKPKQKKQHQPVKKDNIPVPPKKIVRPVRSDFGGKPRMDDIKASKEIRSKSKIQTYGLADEFRLMTLEDFRKLGSAQDAVDSLVKKLEIIGQESIKDKISAINGLRASELNKKYIAIGQASIGGAKKLSDALADASLNPDKMTEDEFFAIASLNSRLK